MESTRHPTRRFLLTTVAIMTSLTLAATDAVAEAPEWCPAPADIDEEALYRGVEALAPPAARRAWPAWDRHTRPLRWDEVGKVGLLRKEDTALIERQGFAVLEDGQDNPVNAYATLYTRDLPIFVTMESLFWAVAVGHQALLEAVETGWVWPETEAILDALAHAASPTSPLAKLGSVEARVGVDLYLTVARSLLSGALVEPAQPTNREPVRAWVRAIEGAGGGGPAQGEPGAGRPVGLVTMEIFGRGRAVDLSLFVPRGAYAEGEARRRWFRGLTWLTRFELNVVSRDCRSSEPSIAPDPRETPLEAEIAWLLGRLSDLSGVAERLGRVTRVLDRLVAPRVDVAPAELARDGGQGFVHGLSAAALQGRFVRRTATHPMPPVRDLPVVSTLFGLRTTESTGSLASFLSPSVPGRLTLEGSEVAVALGHAEARRFLGAELEAHPTLGPALDHAGVDFARAVAPGTLRSAWLEAILGLGTAPEGITPSFVRDPAWADFNANTALAAYTRLRRNHIAYEAAPFSGGGCDVPDGFVEPAPTALARLTAYAQIGQGLAAEFDPRGDLGVSAYYKRLERVMHTLSRIVARELAGAPLEREALEFLHQIVERRDNIYESTVAFDGWFVDLFFSRQALSLRRPGGLSTHFDARAEGVRGGVLSNAPEALEQADVAVDVATARSEDGAFVNHLGTSRSRWGVFVVDSGGPPRVLLGPVSLAYSAARPHPERLTDEAARRLGPRDRHAPWTRSFAPTFTRKKARLPNTKLVIDCWPRQELDDSTCQEVRVSWESDGPVGPVEVMLADVDGRVLATRSAKVPKGRKQIVFGDPSRRVGAAARGGKTALPGGANRVKDKDLELDEVDEVEAPSGWTESVAAVIVRRGLDEWSFSLDTGSRGVAFPWTFELGPRAEARAARWVAEGEGDSGDEVRGTPGGGEYE